MAAQPVQYARSARFISAYLAFWGLMAAGGLTYLGSLAWQTDFVAPQPLPQVSEGEQALRAATRALTELSTVRRTVADVQKDVGRVKEAVDQQESKTKESQARISALEERVTSIAATAAAPPPAQQKLSEKARARAADRAAARSPRIINVGEAAPKAAAPTPDAAPKIETGSIAPSAADPIVFGAPVVTRTTSSFAVQLGASPSLESLKTQWGQLLAQHGDVLAALEPRYVPPRAAGGSYRLMAGPLPTRADADKICAGMGVSRNQCFSTTFIGQRL